MHEAPGRCVWFTVCIDPSSLHPSEFLPKDHSVFLQLWLNPVASFYLKNEVEVLGVNPGLRRLWVFFLFSPLFLPLPLLQEQHALVAYWSREKQDMRRLEQRPPASMWVFSEKPSQPYNSRVLADLQMHEWKINDCCLKTLLLGWFVTWPAYPTDGLIQWDVIRLLVDVDPIWKMSWSSVMVVGGPGPDH